MFPTNSTSHQILHLNTLILHLQHNHGALSLVIKCAYLGSLDHNQLANRQCYWLRGLDPIANSGLAVLDLTLLQILIFVGFCLLLHGFHLSLYPLPKALDHLRRSFRQLPPNYLFKLMH